MKITKVTKLVKISDKHHALLKYMVLILSLTGKESNTSLVERLIVAYAKQMTMTIKGDAYRGKLLELINEAEKITGKYPRGGSKKS